MNAPLCLVIVMCMQATESGLYRRTGNHDDDDMRFVNIVQFY